VTTFVALESQENYPIHIRHCHCTSSWINELTVSSSSLHAKHTEFVQIFVTDRCTLSGKCPVSRPTGILTAMTHVDFCCATLLRTFAACLSWTVAEMCNKLHNSKLNSNLLSSVQQVVENAELWLINCCLFTFHFVTRLWYAPFSTLFSPSTSPNASSCAY